MPLLKHCGGAVSFDKGLVAILLRQFEGVPLNGQMIHKNTHKNLVAKIFAEIKINSVDSRPDRWETQRGHGRRSVSSQAREKTADHAIQIWPVWIST